MPEFVSLLIRPATTSGKPFCGAGATSARLWPWEREKPALLWSVEANRRRLPARPGLDRLAASA